MFSSLHSERAQSTVYRKQKKSVLCTLYLTGSNPPFDRGWHLKIRETESLNALKNGYFRNVSFA